MFFSALGGMLRVGAVVLTAGALGGGVYFLVQAGDSQDADTRLQAPTGPTATVEAPRDLSPPDDLSGPVDVKAPPTPTFPPAAIADPGIDTSDWKTYISPLGFTLKYPPDWVVVEDPTGRIVKIENESRQAERARHLAAGATEGVSGGNAWIEISPDAFPEFDMAEVFEICRPSRPLVQSAWKATPSEVSIGGQPAVRCVGSGPSPNGRHHMTTEGYYIELPPGHVLRIGFLAVEGEAIADDQIAHETLRTVLLSLSVEATS